MILRDLPERKPALQKCLLKRQEAAERKIKAIEEGKYDQKGTDSLTFFIFKDFLSVSICHYSLGNPLFEIENSLKRAVDLYTKTDYGNPVNKEFYFDHLTFIALSILIDIDEQKMQSLVNKWLSYNAADRLIDFLIASRDPEHAIAETCLFEKPYVQAAAIFEEPNPSSALSQLGDYLKPWYKNHKGFYWYDSHKAKGPAYSGYWCFEAAAIAKIKKLPLGNSKLGQYFPYSFFNLPEQLKPEKKKSIPKASKGCQRIFYPGLESLSFEVPDNWINESKERLGLISADGLLEVAGTVYRAPGKSLNSFTQIRHQSLQKKMPWYQPISELKSMQFGKFKAFQKSYEGIWPGENETTYYLVTTFGFDDYFMGLTFACLSKNLAVYEREIKRLLASARYKTK